MPRLSFHKLPAILVILVVSWLTLRLLLPIALPFLLAALLAFTAEPLVLALQRYFRLSRGAASAIGVTISMLLSILLLLALCALLVRELSALAGVLPDLESATVSGLDSLEIWLLGLAQKTPKGISPILVHGVEGMFSNGSALLDQVSSKLLTMATSLLKTIPDSALGLGTWILASFMISSRLATIRQWLRSHLPASWKERYLPHLNTLKKSLWGWLKAQAKLVGITFCILLAGFLLLRISHPFLWAGMVCLVDILPILGTGTVLIPWALVCFLQNDALRAVGLLGVYTIITLIRSVLEPRLVGKHMGLDPLVTLLSIYAGYRLWGLPGMLIAPVLAVAATQFFRPAEKSI